MSQLVPKFPNLDSKNLPTCLTMSQLRLQKCPNLSQNVPTKTPNMSQLVSQCPNLDSKNVPTCPKMSQLRLQKCPNLSHNVPITSL